MAKVYLTTLSAFIKKACDGCFENIPLECKHFFSGAALYADERICVSLTPAGLAMKLPEKTKLALFKNHQAIPLQYFPQGPIKKDYALFPDGVTGSSQVLHKYVKESIAHVLTIPKPARKSK